MLAPIIVPVYDRFLHLQRCIESLRKNSLAKDSVIYIVSDAAYKPEHEDAIAKVREYIDSVSGFKEIHRLYREKNLGAADSIGQAMDEAFSSNDCFIFLEDDIVVSEDFLQYMNDGLDYYRGDKSVFAICGFKLPFEMPSSYKEDVYFYPCNSPWGFATWKDRWKKVNHGYFDRYSELHKDRKRYKQFSSIGFYIKGILQADSRKEIVAGDLRVYYHMFQNKMYSVFPVVSKTQNHGFDGTGEHCNTTRAWWAEPELDQRNRKTQFIPFSGFNKEILENSRKFQDKINGGFLTKHLKYTWVHRLWKRIKR